MMNPGTLFTIASALLTIATSTSAQTVAPPRAPAIARIVDEGFSRSQATAIARELADGIGGRLTNSPAMRQAERWAEQRLRGWGVTDVRREAFDFGRGWRIDRVAVSMTAPRRVDLHTIPVAWTPGTGTPVIVPVVVAPLRTAADFAVWHGRLAGKAVLVSTPTDPSDDERPGFYRLKTDDIAAHDVFEQPVPDPTLREDRVASDRFAVARDVFLKAEGAVAWIRMSAHGAGAVSGEGYQFRVGFSPMVPGLEMAAEDYRRVARIASDGDVGMSIDVRTTYFDDDPHAYNLIADLPGRNHDAGYVMAGAHLDSWVAADGATDNGAGVAVVMEAARILATLHLPTRRTIRFSLWSGEEQGLLGSYAYVARHLATRPAEPEADKRRFGPGDYETWPITPLPGYRDLAAYFNIDNGAGRIRGIYAAGNLAAVSPLERWLAPFRSLGAANVSAVRNNGSDQDAFTEVGLPAFQFIQDPLDYRFVHHTDLDTFDHLRAADLRQSAVILASLLVEAANAPEPLPATPLPTKPAPTGDARR